MTALDGLGKGFEPERAASPLAPPAWPLRPLPFLVQRQYDLANRAAMFDDRHRLSRLFESECPLNVRLYRAGRHELGNFRKFDTVSLYRIP